MGFGSKRLLPGAAPRSAGECSSGSLAVGDAPPGVCVGGGGVGRRPWLPAPSAAWGIAYRGRGQALRSGLAVLLSPGERKLKMSVLRKTDFSRSHTSLFQKM